MSAYLNFANALYDAHPKHSNRYSPSGKWHNHPGKLTKLTPGKFAAQLGLSNGYYNHLFMPSRDLMPPLHIINGLCKVWGVNGSTKRNLLKLAGAAWQERTAASLPTVCPYTGKPISWFPQYDTAN